MYHIYIYIYICGARRSQWGNHGTIATLVLLFFPSTADVETVRNIIVLFCLSHLLGSTI